MPPKKFVFLLFALLLAACDTIIIPLSPAAPPDPLATSPVVSWYSLYFTEPNGPNAETLRGGPDAALAEAINQARLSVDVAIYDLNLWSLRDALLAAHTRGVVVHIVAETDNLDRPEFDELADAGISIVDDSREGLMHNKFVVIDRFEVWTGSMNFTVNSAYHGDNNLIRIRSSRLAENYLAEFEEMFVAGQFGGSSPANTPNPVLMVEGTQIEVYFSPDDGTAAHLLQLINQAQESVLILAFSFTSDEIADALIAAQQRGVTVAAVFETSQASGQGSEFFRLADLGMLVELDGNPDDMHHKVIIIDRRIVVLGSYNFSANAEERNDENTLVIYNLDIALRFIDEFNRIFELRQ